jgi:hypothetical protein
MRPRLVATRLAVIAVAVSQKLEAYRAPFYAGYAAARPQPASESSISAAGSGRA